MHVPTVQKNIFTICNGIHQYMTSQSFKKEGRKKKIRNQRDRQLRQRFREQLKF